MKDFIEAMFAQLRDGKTTATFDFTEGLSRAAQDVIQPILKKLNQLGRGMPRAWSKSALLVDEPQR